MTVTIADAVLAVEIFITMGVLSAVVTYILREVQRLRERLRSINNEVKRLREQLHSIESEPPNVEKEVKKHDKETVTMEDHE